MLPRRCRRTEKLNYGIRNKRVAVFFYCNFRTHKTYLGENKMLYFTCPGPPIETNRRTPLL